MARTEALGEPRVEAPGDDAAVPSPVDHGSSAELEREILGSETIEGDAEPDELLGRMTQTLAIGASDQTNPGETVDGDQRTIATQIGANDRSGEVIHGRYQLVRQLGKGGMGTVYIGRHVNLPKTFAIKVLNARYANRRDIAERFLREAQAVSLIEHENVVSVVDFGREDDGAAFLVMEHLRGESLSALCKREAPLPWPRVEHIMLQICRALQAAHDVGIIHRDIKPENVLRVGRHDDDDFIKILDFGLAKMQVSGGLRLTQTGMVLGTPDYMSPEQARGRAVDHRADIYSAGIMMYELLCGRVPFKATTFDAMRQKHLLEPPEPPSKWVADMANGEAIDAIVLRALAKDPEHRFASMAEMGQAIEAVGTGAAPVELPAPGIVPLLSENSVLQKLGGGLPSAPRRGNVAVGATLPMGSIDPDAIPKPEPEPEPDHASGSTRWWLLAAVVALAALGGVAIARSQGVFDGSREQPAAPAPEPEPSKLKDNGLAPDIRDPFPGSSPS